MFDLERLLAISSSSHSHLCPRQILGVRLGLAGLSSLGLAEPPSGKRLVTILETDGCFADGVMAVTQCSVGHRTLRVEDYGKTAATFVDTQSGRAVRVAPVLDVRARACAWVPEEPRHYFAQMKAYRLMPDEQLFSVSDVCLTTPVERMVSRPGVRATCSICGEEIMNEREVEREGSLLCRACAGSAYYRETVSVHRFELGLRDA